MIDPPRIANFLSAGQHNLNYFVRKRKIKCVKCVKCVSMTTEILQELEDSDASEEKKARVLFNYKERVQNISAWKAHLLRSVNQEEVGQDTLDNLNQENCLIVMDWAMKFLLHHYREHMSEFFEKRARSWHVSAVITKSSTAEKFQALCICLTCVPRTASP